MYNFTKLVIRKIILLISENNYFKQIHIAKLKQAIQQGIDSGESTPLNMSEIITKAKQRRQ